MSIDATTIALLKKCCSGATSGSDTSGDGQHKLEKDYNNLENKPKINNVELSGNVTLEMLGLSQTDKDTMPIKYLSADATAEDILNLDEGFYYLPKVLTIKPESSDNNKHVKLCGFFTYYPESSETFYNIHEQDVYTLPAIDTKHSCIYGLTKASAKTDEDTGGDPQMYDLSCKNETLHSDSLLSYIEGQWRSLSSYQFKITSETEDSFELEEHVDFSYMCSQIEDRLSECPPNQRPLSVVSLYDSSGSFYLMNGFNNESDGTSFIQFSGMGGYGEYKVYTVYPDGNVLGKYDLYQLQYMSDTTPVYISIVSETDNSFELDEYVDISYLLEVIRGSIDSYGLILFPNKQVSLVSMDESGGRQYYVCNGIDDTDDAINIRFSGIASDGKYKVYTISQATVENSTMVNTVKTYDIDNTNIPDWAKQPEKPTYTPVEVGAKPAERLIITVEIDNDSEDNSEQPVYKSDKTIPEIIQAYRDGYDMTVNYIRPNGSDDDALHVPLQFKEQTTELSDEHEIQSIVFSGILWSKDLRIDCRFVYDVENENGTFLQVNETKIHKEKFVIKVTVDEENSLPDEEYVAYTGDKTISEIDMAYSAGCDVMVELSDIYNRIYNGDLNDGIALLQLSTRTPPREGFGSDYSYTFLGMDVHDRIVSCELSSGFADAPDDLFVYIQYYDIEDKRLERIQKSSKDTICCFSPNEFYIFPEMQTLTYTLSTPQDSDIVNEYHFMFVSGDTPTELIHSEGVNIGDLTIEANRIYEISVVENLLTWNSWEVAT